MEDRRWTPATERSRELLRINGGKVSSDPRYLHALRRSPWWRSQPWQPLWGVLSSGWEPEAARLEKIRRGGLPSLAATVRKSHPPLKVLFDASLGYEHLCLLP